MDSDNVPRPTGEGNRREGGPPQEPVFPLPALKIEGVEQYLHQVRTSAEGQEALRLLTGLAANDPEVDAIKLRNSTLVLVLQLKALRSERARDAGKELADRYPRPLRLRLFYLAAHLYQEGKIPDDPGDLLEQPEVIERLVWEAAEDSWPVLFQNVIKDWPEDLDQDSSFRAKLHEAAADLVGVDAFTNSKERKRRETQRPTENEDLDRRQAEGHKSITQRALETFVAKEEIAVRWEKANLTPSEERATRLRYWEDLSSKEIANQMGSTENAVNVHLSNARKKLRKTI